MAGLYTGGDIFLNDAQPNAETVAVRKSILAAPKKFAEERKIPKGEMIIGCGYDENVVPKGRLINRDDHEFSRE